MLAWPRRSGARAFIIGPGARVVAAVPKLSPFRRNGGGVAPDRQGTRGFSRAGVRKCRSGAVHGFGRSGAGKGVGHACPSAQARPGQRNRARLARWTEAINASRNASNWADEAKLEAQKHRENHLGVTLVTSRF